MDVFVDEAHIKFMQDPRIQFRFDFLDYVEHRLIRILHDFLHHNRMQPLVAARLLLELQAHRVPLEHFVVDLVPLQPIIPLILHILHQHLQIRLKITNLVIQLIILLDFDVFLSYLEKVRHICSLR